MFKDRVVVITGAANSGNATAPGWIDITEQTFSSAHNGRITIDSEMTQQMIYHNDQGWL